MRLSETFTSPKIFLEKCWFGGGSETVTFPFTFGEYYRKALGFKKSEKHDGFDSISVDFVGDWLSNPSSPYLKTP